MPRCYKAPPSEILANLEVRRTISWGDVDWSVDRFTGREYSNRLKLFMICCNQIRRKYMNSPVIDAPTELFFGSEILQYKLPEPGSPATLELLMEVLNWSGFVYDKVHPDPWTEETVSVCILRRRRRQPLASPTPTP
ncbi:hypothetical protein TWF718_010162 [Orbilia javanica]|uniref:Uncharacterized protein n=1 Tax=Orbilia javanica TaxID=47235 RepID=A0AAN8MNX9_9PEZI